MNGDKPNDDDAAEVSLDVDDVDLAEAAPGARGTAPPPLPAYVSAPPASPSLAPVPPDTAPPRGKLVYVLVLAACLAASIAIGAVWARSSAPKTAAVSAPPSAAASPAPSAAASAAPKVITINPVDMSNEAP
jgi:hypothetical protein